jgi:hypothetical protein
LSRTLQFFLFFSTVLTLVGLMQWYLYVSYRRWILQVAPERSNAWLRRARVVLLAGNLVFLLSLFGRGLGIFEQPTLRLMVVYPAGMWFGSIILGFVLLFIKDGLRLLIGLARTMLTSARRFRSSSSATIPASPAAIDPGRRHFLTSAGTATIGLIAATPVAASLATARDYQVRRIPLTFPNLPAELEGFTIAHVSDIHSGIYMSRLDMEHIFEIVNRLHPNLAVLTGDLVDTNDTEIPPLHEALKTLKADRGAYAVLGNHDHFATGDRVAEAVRQSGLRVLRNAHETITVDGAKLSLVGVDDPSPRRNFADVPKAIDGLDPESFKVMLVHQPRLWGEAKRVGMDLTLVGHTHGGQIGMEMLGMQLYPVRWVYDHPMGHFIEEGKQLYVNVGVGMVGAPIRLVRPEIALFELRRGEPVRYRAEKT